MLELILVLGFVLTVVDVLAQAAIAVGCFLLSCLIVVIAYVVALVVRGAMRIEDR